MRVGADGRIPFYLLAALSTTALIAVNWGQTPKHSFHAAVPRMWDDAAMATLEVPLSDPIGSPKHVSADYYYKFAVRSIYKSYQVYAPGHEPPGYIEWLKLQEPVSVWDDAGHRPPLQTKADRVKAGEFVFDASIFYGGVAKVSDIQQPGWYEKRRATLRPGALRLLTLAAAQSLQIRRSCPARPEGV